MTQYKTDPTITRRELLDIAFEAINSSAGEVDQTTRSHLLYTAATIPEVARGRWVIDDECGCLVGSMMLNDPEIRQRLDARTISPAGVRLNDAVPGEVDGDLLHIGLEFDRLLRNLLGADVSPGTRVQVVD